MRDFYAVSLVATVRTALRASRQIGDRRAGRDPSDQEPEARVRADLSDLRAALAEATARLRLRAVVGAPDGEAALARAFEDRIAFDDLGRLLSVIHQKLLSLYPSVDADLVERVRQMAARVVDHALADDLDVDIGLLAVRVGNLADDLAEVVA